ncbi:Ig-like domain repeat protein [Nocardioides yefusunii]|uniref:Ig-like domain repeat protein n=1 Tax=Nocardioides yefusunii TaxID=2500546 RepID=UPI00366ABCCE
MSLLASMLFVPMPVASAHRDGCHAAHSCPSDTGSYICGDTGNFSECGYTSLPSVGTPRTFASAAPPPDHEAPDRPAVSRITAAKGGSVSLRVDAERGSKIVVKSKGTKYATVTATGGAQELRFKAPDGKRTFAVTATDAAGNRSSVQRFTVVADAKAPSLDGLVLTSGSSAQAWSLASFNAGEPATYKLFVDGKQVAAGDAGAAQTEVPFPVANGLHVVTVKLADAAGNAAKVRRSITVDIDSLNLEASVGGATSEAQKLTVRGTRDATAVVNGLGDERTFVLTDGTAEIDLDLPDGTYDNVAVTLTDQFGRTGRTLLERVVVDTVRPVVKLVRRTERRTRGRLVLAVGTEAGAALVWRAVDQNGKEVGSGEETTGEDGALVDVDLEEGDYKVETTVRDAAGNETKETQEFHVDSDPWGWWGWSKRILAVLALLFLGLLVAGWRINRKERKEEEARARAEREAVERKAKAERDAEARRLAEIERARLAEEKRQREAAARAEAHRAWEQRGDFLRELCREAREWDGVTAAEVPDGIKLKSGERVYGTSPGVLVEARTRQNVPTLVGADSGTVTVTDRRVVFRGPSKKREWLLDSIDDLQRQDDVFLIGVTQRKTLSGVDLSGQERALLHLNLALAGVTGERDFVVKQQDDALARHLASDPEAVTR